VGSAVEAAEGRQQHVIALIPAHNEELTVAATVGCLRAQRRPPDRVVVACDNCTDGTERVARQTGAEVFVTQANTDMKAGALNQALSHLLPGLDDRDVILVVDADSLVSDNFVSEALTRFSVKPMLGGLSGVYAGKPGGGLVGWCQRNEFARWGFDARQQDGKAICLSGAASAFTVRAIRTVIAARVDGALPGGHGFYNTLNFTEDFEVTQALKHLGFEIRNMMRVSISTAVKTTWGELHVQRLRWNRGITETLLAFGLTRHTAQMWLRWAIYILSVLAIPMSLFLLSYRFAAGDGWRLNLWVMLWLAITAVIMIHKSVTIARTRGWSAVVAFLLVPELVYDAFLHLTFVRALWNTTTGASKKWR
jgi:biofilm PGA synthesis N-glycosyltransferase PgaC